MKKWFSVFLVAIMALGLNAQEFGSEAGAEETSDSANEVVEAGPAIGVDGGTEIVEIAQESEPAPASPKFKSASKLLKELAKKKGWKENWDEDKQRIIVFVDADFTTKDPKNDKDLFVKREMAAKKAALMGKAAIIETINTEMSASDKLDMPGTDVNKELGAEAEKVKNAMVEQQMMLASLLEKYDEAEAEVLRGTTFGDRLKELLEATIKKLDKEYDPDKRDEVAMARLEKVQAAYEAVSEEFEALKEKAEKLQESVQERQESSVETLARMPLYGATVIMQTESWDPSTGKYQVAMAYTWSKALERAVRAIVTGEDYKTKPGKKSVNDWLDDQDLATMVGSRQYLDNKGNRWFLGITARKYDDNMNSTARSRNKLATEQFAKQMAAFCVFGDVESYKMAQQAKETRGDGEGDYAEQLDAVAESAAQKLTQAFSKKTIRGLQKLATQETQHPVTGDDILIVVYGVNASSAAKALEIEKINYATKVMDNQYQTVERGRKAANEAKVKASENRAEDFQKGYKQQSDAIQGELDQRAEEKKPKGIRVINKGQAPVNRVKQNTGGAFGGDVDVDDDF